jgi:hypothetical protein
MQLVCIFLKLCHESGTIIAQWLGDRPIYTDLLERSLARQTK